MLARRFSPSYTTLLSHARSARMLSTQTTSIFQRLGLPTSGEVAGVYNGTWGGRGALTQSLNPATGEVLAQVRQASKEDVEETLHKARGAYEAWRSVPAPQRGLVLQDIGRALEKHKEDLGAVVSMEMGKIRTEGKGEVQVSFWNGPDGLPKGRGELTLRSVV